MRQICFTASSIKPTLTNIQENFSIAPNEILLCIDALIGREFGEIDSKNSGHVTGPRPVLVLGNSLRYRRAQERKRDATSGTVPARALDSDFATASTHPLLHQRLCPRLHHSFHFRLTKTFVHLRLPLPTSLAHLQPLIGIAHCLLRR